MAAHGHGHDHGHSHAVSADADRRYLWIALGLMTALMIAQVIIGVVADSLALLADAAHMISDSGALALSLFAMAMAAKPARGAFTYGFKRVEIISALLNGATLVVLAAYFVYASIGRLIAPGDPDGMLVLVVSLVGIVVNLLATWVLSKANRESLNVEGSYQHILTDLYAFIGTAVAGAVILWTGFVRADAIASLFVAALMLKAGYVLIREGGRVVLEAAPRGIDPDRIAADITALDAVIEVHDLHVWEVTSGFPALSAHVLVEDEVDCHATRLRLERLLGGDYGIDHTTLQVDHAAEAARHAEHGEDGVCPPAVLRDEH